MKIKIITLIPAILMLIMSLCGQASAFSNPPTWMPMTQATITTATLSIAGITGPGTFSVTTDPFSFTSQTGVDPAAIYESNAITVTGIDTAAAVSISTGGSYAISTDNGETWGAWTSSAGTISLNNQVKVRNTSSSSPSTAVITTLTIGGVTGSFSITTNAYTAPPTWSPMTMLNISLSNGQLAFVEEITKSPFSGTPATTWPALSTVAGSSLYDPAKPWALLNGKSYSRRLGWNPDGNNAAALKSAVETNYGANASIWIERISASDGLEAYQAVGKYGVNANGTTTIDPAANGYTPIFGTSGSSTKWKWDYQMDHNVYAVPAAYITTPNQLFTATYRIYIGDSTTGADIAPSAAYTTTWTWQGPATVPGNRPDAFSFTSQTGVALNSVIESNAVTLTGLAVPALISITGGEYSVSTDGSTWSTYSATTPATVANGNLVKVRQTSSASHNTLTTTVLTIGGVTGSFDVTTSPEPVTVPNVVGSTQANAQSAITTATLTVGTITQEYSATVPAGSVISQNPGAGASVAPGTAVDLVVSTGPAPVTVPNVVGSSLADATSAITTATLTVGIVTQTFSATVPAWSVISQNPGAFASVAPGTAVDLVVSTGPAPVTVPNVVGKTQSKAQALLTAKALTIGTITQAHSVTVRSGSVISQNPPNRASVAPGTAVDLVVSTGPAPVTVPNVVGRTRAEAKSDLTAANLRSGAITKAHSATVPSGSVISQNPPAGTAVAPRTAVKLVVSTGP